MTTTDTKTTSTCKVGKGTTIHAIDMNGRRPATFPVCGQPRRMSRPHSFAVRGAASTETVTCKQCRAAMGY